MMVWRCLENCYTEWDGNSGSLATLLESSPKMTRVIGQDLIVDIYIDVRMIQF